MTTKVFISFEHHHKDRALWINRRLTEDSFQVTIEDDFGAQSPRAEVIYAIRNCDIVVSIITPQYAHSRATQRELDYAEAYGKNVIALFAGLPSRGPAAQPFTAYRRLELNSDWDDSDEQWTQLLELLVRALGTEATRPGAHDDQKEAASTLEIPPEVAVLIYDLEDRPLADIQLMQRPRWRRANGAHQDTPQDDDIPRILLWTAASAESHSLARRAFESLPGESPKYILVAPGAPEPEHEDLCIPLSLVENASREPELTSNPTGNAARILVQSLNARVQDENENIPMDVFVERFCCSADTADLAAESYELAIRELRAGDDQRARAVYNHALALRFHGSWRKAVEMIQGELIAMPSKLDPDTANIYERLKLELLSLEYELGDQRLPGLRPEIERIQLWFRKAGDLQGYVQAGRVLGNALREKGDFDPAERVIERNIGVAEYLSESGESGYRDLVLADCIRELALLYIARFDLRRARECMADATAILEANQSSQRRATRYLSAVMMYVAATLAEREHSELVAGSPTERAQYALESLAEFENPIRAATIYDWLGRAWTSHVPSRQDDLVRSEEYLRKALRIRQSHGHSYTLGVSHMSLGSLYETVGDYSRATENYQEGRQIFNERGLRPALANSHAALARLYCRHSVTDPSANALYREHLELADQEYREMQLDNEGLELRFELQHGGRKPVAEVPDETPLIAVGEYHLHQWIRQYAESHGPAIDRHFTLLHGIGDDAAVVEFQANAPHRGLVYTTDAAPGSLAELGKSPEYVGRFTVVQTLSDVYAMGARPVAIMLNLFLSRAVTVGYSRRLIQTVVAEAARYNCVVLGGDVKERGEQSVGCVGIGYVDTERILTRAGAQPGHALCITLASRPSGKGHRKIGGRWTQELVEHYHMNSPSVISNFPELKRVVDPNAKYDLLYLPDKVMMAAAESGYMRSAMDTSDGVLACLEILGRESDVGFELDEGLIADVIDDRARRLAGVLDLPTFLFMFGAGHDWEMVFTCEQADFDRLAAAVDDELKGNGRVARIGTVVERSTASSSEIAVRRHDRSLASLAYYTDEKFVPRRYQDRPAQWLAFARRFDPRIQPSR